MLQGEKTAPGIDILLAFPEVGFHLAAQKMSAVCGLIYELNFNGGCDYTVDQAD